jgi:hypothetical protein
VHWCLSARFCLPGNGRYALTRNLYELQRRYGRPRVLSDPFHDNTPATLRDLLSKADSDLRWGDFKTLLGPHLPAGTYEQVAYFLPLAFDRIRADKTVALDLCSSLVWFCSEYQEQLAADKVVDTARDQLLDLLRQWTSRFNVTHFDRSMCVAKGWVKLQYFDLVETSETVCQMLCDLASYSTHADIADRFILELISFGPDPIKAAWLLELLRAREGDVYRPPPIQRLELVSADHSLLLSAYELTQTDRESRSRLSPKKPSRSHHRKGSPRRGDEQ